MTAGALGAAILLSTIAGAVPAADPGPPGIQQAATAPQIRPPFAGDCSITVALAGQRRGDVVQLQIGFGRLPAATVAADTQATVDVATGAPLQSGETLVLLINNSEIARATTADSSLRPAGSKPTGTCAIPGQVAFGGKSFDATAYVGWAFDQFAPDGLGNYPPGTTTEMHNRYLLGVDFDYRIAGNDNTSRQFWFAGQTMHGVRSADVDCKAEEYKPPVCEPLKNTPEYAHAILKGSTSLEAYVAPRFEFARIQKDSSTPARVYATMRLGFIALTGAPRVFKNHHIGMGLLADDGPFEGSFFEVGWGLNEMLSGTKFRRLKIDGLVTFSMDRVPVIRDNAKFFIQMYIDNDLRAGTSTPDSIQTFMGFDIDIRRFFGG